MTSPSEEDLDLAFLSAVISTDETFWTANIPVNGETMKFKVDTGAKVTAVTKLALTQLGNAQLHPTTKTLCGPDRKPLKVLGQTSATLSHSGKSCIHDIFCGRITEIQLVRLTCYQRFEFIGNGQSNEFKLCRSH